MKKEVDLLDRMDSYVLWAIAGLSILISLADFLGLLGSVPWLAQRIPTLMLLVGGVIVGYLAWERRKHLDTLHTEVEQGTERVLSALGGEIKFHRGRDQFYEYIVERINQATERIDIITAGTHSTSLYPVKREMHDRYLASIREAARSGKARVRRIRGLSDIHLLQETIDEIESHMEAELYVAVYPLLNTEQVPLLNVMIVDDEVAIGGIYKAASEDVITVTVTHPYVLEMVDDYFNASWSHSIKLNNRTEIDQAAVFHLRDDLIDELEYISSATENYIQSAEVISSAKSRVWIVSTLGAELSKSKSTEVEMYDKSIEKLIQENPEVEFRRILRVTTEEKINEKLKETTTNLNFPNYLLRFVPDQRPAIDCLIRDDDVILLGLRERESSLAHDSVIMVRNRTFIQAVARWYERYLWTYAIPVKDARGIVDEGVAKVHEILLSKEQDVKVEDVRIYHDRDEFWADVKNGIARAEKRVDVTCLRPDQSATSSYYTLLEETVKERGVRMRRVVVFQEPTMVELARRELIGMQGFPYHLGVYNVSWSTLPSMMNFIIIDDREMYAGGGHMGREHKSASFWTNHPFLVQAFSHYFETLWQQSNQVHNVDELDSFLTQAVPPLSVLPTHDETYKVSKDIVRSSTKRRLWVTGFRPIHEDKANSFDEVAAQRLKEVKEMEYKVVTCIRSMGDIEDKLSVWEELFVRSNYLVRAIVGKPYLTDVFISDENELLIGITARETLAGYTNCLRIRDPNVVQAVADWYAIHLWPNSVEIIGKDGPNEAGIAEVKRQLAVLQKGGDI